jgi:transposase-like protein
MESYPQDWLEPDQVIEPGASAVPALGEPDFRRLADELGANAAQRQISLTGEGGLLTRLTQQVLQSALEAEMAHHLGYDKHDPVGRNRGNSRNGTTPKTVTTEIGKVTVDVPRDRDGTFEGSSEFQWG